MNNTGIHHISSLVGNIHQAYHFYHHILGLKLTLKTVNQDDSSMYHLFFGDAEGRFGTEFTIFDMPTLPRQRGGKSFGTNHFSSQRFCCLGILAEKIDRV
ncbi:TPA: VOC family protein [Streptococcus suis]